MEEVTNVETIPAVQSPRDALRGKIFTSANRRGKSKVMPFFGTKIEIRQPSVGQLQDLMEDTNDITLVPILVNYAYVPGTMTKIFEDTDIESIKLLPCNDECMAIIQVLTSFVDLSVEDASKN